MNYNEKIKQRREELGLTPMDFAQRMGWKHTTRVYAVERNARINVETLRRIAEALETEPAFFLTEN